MAKKSAAKTPVSVLTGISGVYRILELIRNPAQAQEFHESFGVSLLHLYKLMFEKGIEEICVVQAASITDVAKDEASKLAAKLHCAVYLGGFVFN